MENIEEIDWIDPRRWTVITGGAMSGGVGEWLAGEWLGDLRTIIVGGRSVNTSGGEH